MATAVSLAGGDRGTAQQLTARLRVALLPGSRRGRADPVLQQLEGLLDDEALYRRVRAELGARFPQTLIHGRHSTPAEVVLRLLLVKHLSCWSYRETVSRVADSLVLRGFCRIYFHAVP